MSLRFVVHPHLVHIFKASLHLGLYPGQWRESITCVFHKLGKAQYNIPKAYRPVALLNTVAKLLSVIVTEGIVHHAEGQGLLPAHHFGGHPGRTTTDSLHLLADTIKSAWHRKQVASVLVLSPNPTLCQSVPRDGWVLKSQSSYYTIHYCTRRLAACPMSGSPC